MYVVNCMKRRINTQEVIAELEFIKNFEKTKYVT